MTIWRISPHATLDGAGGLIESARWHTKGRPVVYCAANPATALLEVLVHFEIDPDDRPATLPFLEIDVPGNLPVAEEGLGADEDSTRAKGDAWLASARTALLRVPSVLAPATFNVLINPAHSDAAHIKVARVHQHPFDSRLRR